MFVFSLRCISSNWTETINSGYTRIHCKIIQFNHLFAVQGKWLCVIICTLLKFCIYNNGNWMLSLLLKTFYRLIMPEESELRVKYFMSNMPIVDCIWHSVEVFSQWKCHKINPAGYFSHPTEYSTSLLNTEFLRLTFGCEMTDCVLRRGFRGPALVCGVLILGET